MNTEELAILSVANELAKATAAIEKGEPYQGDLSRQVAIFRGELQEVFIRTFRIRFAQALDEWAKKTRRKIRLSAESFAGAGDKSLFRVEIVDA